MIDVHNLTKHYGPVRAVDDLTFTVKPGVVTGFLGPNGAGKSTTMRMIMGLLATHGGEVRWNGSPITTLDRRRIGYMPEERGLYPKMKVGEQLSFLARLHGMSASAATESTRRWTERLGA